MAVTNFDKPVGTEIKQLNDQIASNDISNLFTINQSLSGATINTFEAYKSGNVINVLVDFTISTAFTNSSKRLYLFSGNNAVRPINRCVLGTIYRTGSPDELIQSVVGYMQRGSSTMDLFGTLGTGSYYLNFTYISIS